MAAAVLFFLFSSLLAVDTQGIPFLSFTFSGLLLWNYFSFVLSQSASSLIASQSMLQKIYFPRILLPLSKGLLGLIELLVALVLFLAIAFADGQLKTWGLLSFIPLLMSTLAAAWGAGLWLSALSIRFRDLQQALPFLLQMLFFISPIAYSPALVQERIPLEWQGLYYINPINGILELFRSAIFGLDHHPQAWLSLGVSLLLFVSGWWYFHKVERKIADLI
jgi:lipopolysaccharide transport system permease protein